MKKEINKKIPIKRIILLAVVILIAIILLLFGTKIYLYARSAAGSDLIVKASADKENIFLTHGSSDKVAINSYALANFFCNIECSSRFIQLSTAKVLLKEDFSFKFSRIKTYDLTAPEYGQGQELYRYELECNTTKSFLCATKAEAKKTTLLITLNYEPNEKEKDIAHELEPQIESLAEKISYYGSYLPEFENSTNKLNTTEADSIKDSIKKLGILTDSTNQSLQKIITLWDNQDYVLLNQTFPEFNYSFSSLENGFNELNSTVYSNISAYNLLIKNITEIKNKLINFKSLNISENSTRELRDLIDEFNNLTLIFPNKDSLSNKQARVYALNNKVNYFSPELLNVSDLKLNKSINNLNFSEITINSVNFTLFQLTQPSLKCCLNNKCESCCDDSCYNDSEKYPIIFVHGHSFSKDASADSSLDAFEGIQETLDKDDYINAGSLLLSPYDENLKGIWGKFQHPVSIKASYYFDLLNKGGESSIIETKTDNIDTYTLRLRDSINAVKYKTNREKVILIGHSMGGLIIRRYIQVFGEADIDKIILISTPNKGITKKALDFCTYFGTKLECQDMAETSLFMGKLNTAPKISVPIYNLISTGCNTEGEMGDGVVKNSSQYLEGAKNYYINGTCKESDFVYLHTEILKINQYPEVLDIIKKALNHTI